MGIFFVKLTKSIKNMFKNQFCFSFCKTDTGLSVYAYACKKKLTVLQVRNALNFEVL